MNRINVLLRTRKFCSSKHSVCLLIWPCSLACCCTSLKCLRASGWEWEGCLFLIFYLFLSAATWIFNKEAGLICVRGVENSQYEFLKALTRFNPLLSVCCRRITRERAACCLIYENTRQGYVRARLQPCRRRLLLELPETCVKYSVLHWERRYNVRH